MYDEPEMTPVPSHARHDSSIIEVFLNDVVYIITLLT